MTFSFDSAGKSLSSINLVMLPINVVWLDFDCACWSVAHCSLGCNQIHTVPHANFAIPNFNLVKALLSTPCSCCKEHDPWDVALMMHQPHNKGISHWWPNDMTLSTKPFLVNVDDLQHFTLENKLQGSTWSWHHKRCPSLFLLVSKALMAELCFWKGPLEIKRWFWKILIAFMTWVFPIGLSVKNWIWYTYGRVGKLHKLFLNSFYHGLVDPKCFSNFCYFSMLEMAILGQCCNCQNKVFLSWIC